MSRRHIAYHPPYDSFGHPIDPALLYDLGQIVHPPKRINRSTDAHDNIYRIWTTTARRGLDFEQGGVRLLSVPGNNDERVLEVWRWLQGSQPGEQRPHYWHAQCRHRRDQLSSLVAWRWNSVFATADDLNDHGGGSCPVVPRQDTATSVLTTEWGIFDALTRLPFSPGVRHTFTLFESLAKTKAEQHLEFTGTQSFRLGSEEVRLHRFQQWGRGVLPTDYWVDDERRVWLRIDCNRCLIHSDLSDHLVQPPTWPSAPIRRPAPSQRSSLTIQSQRPNILVLCTDQQHIDTIRTAGCAHVHTPAMDRLWQGGTSFVRSYCTNPLCSPSRSSLFTGRMPSETGVCALEQAIDPALPNLGQWLQSQAGYATFYAGKWHVPDCHTYSIPGFSVLTSGQDHRGDFSDDLVAQACATFLRRYDQPQPFLLVASLTQPHDICEWHRLHQLKLPSPPLVADVTLPPLPSNFHATPGEPRTLHDLRRKTIEGVVGEWPDWQWQWYRWSYYRMIEMVDAEIGRILAALDQSPHARDTLVVLTSDHGEGLGEHRFARKNYTYEAALKVPLVYYWPRQIKGGRTDRTHLVSGVDMMPTLCHYAGIAPPHDLTGDSLHPLLEDVQSSWRDKLGVQLTAGVKARVFLSGKFKYVVFLNDPVEQLFDLDTDPGETVNLAIDPRYESILRQLRSEHATWEANLRRHANDDGWPIEQQTKNA